MPLLKYGAPVPGWCEMTTFDIVALAAGESHTFERTSPKEKLIVGKGACRVAYAGTVADATPGQSLDLETPGSNFEVLETSADTVLIRMGGRWGDELGGSGIFSVVARADPHDTGDPVPYPKATNFDSHYHDCDEYWVLIEGRGIAVSEGQAHNVGPGDCIATAMGHHHDFPQVHEPVHAVYFETTLRGRKRRGHLWEHTHGLAEPQPDRV